MSNYLRIPVWVVPLLVAGLVAGLGWWGNHRLRETVSEELGAHLSSTLTANVMALEIWATNQFKLARSLANETAMQALAFHALQPVPVTQTNPGLPSVSSAAEELSRYLGMRLAGLGYEIAHVVNTNFIVVATSLSGQAGAGWTIADAHVAKFSKLFVSGKPVLITPFKSKRPRAPLPAVVVESHPAPATNAEGPPGTKIVPAGSPLPTAAVERPKQSDTWMQVAVPLQGAQGEVVGALALVINPDAEFARILSVARAGTSGETYVFDQRGLMLSPSRFDDQLRELGLIAGRRETSSAAEFYLRDPGDLQSSENARLPTTNQPLTRIVANAVSGRSGVDVEPSRDYRGIPVVGAFMWLPHHGFGIATQVDAQEAFRPLRVLNLIFTILFLLLALSATALFVASYLGVLWRKRLTEVEVRLKQLGQYTLEEKIGEGAMGVVYRAQHALMRRKTAVKLLLPDRADPISVQRFEREVRLSSQLTHPNTIQVYDYGHTPEGVFYCAMELLRGLNLHELVAQFGSQIEARVVYILTQICESLAEAHALGLVHRDIKPANVFVCDRGGRADWVKVLDFGLVRVYRDGKGGRSAGLAGAIAAGTPLFMPPEAFADSTAADPRSDIYSLGALAYYLLTAQYVFEATSDAELFHKHLTEPPIPPSRRTLNPISAELEETILRCLEKEPNLRPQSADELRQLLSTSPHANGWTLEERQNWWVRYRAIESGQVPESEVNATSPLEGATKVIQPAL